MRAPARARTDDLAAARAECRAAWLDARQGADAPRTVLLDRVYARVLTASAGQRPEVAAELFRRARIWLTIEADMAGWSAGVFRGFAEASPPSRSTRAGRRPAWDL